MRILQVGNAQIRRFGKARVSTEYKILNGLIRNNHHVLHFSDRDMAAFLAPFKLRDLGIGKMNRKLIETAVNFRPDMILLGHCDLIHNDTLASIRKKLPEVRVGYRNVDPLFVPHNIPAIHQRTESADAIFVTTAGSGLNQFKGKRAAVHYMPNPTDASIETLDNASAENLPYDLFFCGNSDEHTERTNTINYLHEELREGPVNFQAFGYFDNPNVWGHAYEDVLSKSKMGLNLNRQEDFLYSSARLAQLMANGILAFIHKGGAMHKLLGEDSAVYFDTKEALLDQVKSLHGDDSMRKTIASNGRKFYRKHFSSDAVSQYIVERTMGLPLSKDYIWADY
jgi:hypothetical protein